MKQSDFAKHATLGFEFFASIALFTWLGYKLDTVAGFSDGFPLFLLLGVFLGVGLAATLGGTLWWALTKNPATESSTSVESTTKNNTRINLIPGWGVSLEGRF